MGCCGRRDIRIVADYTIGYRIDPAKSKYWLVIASVWHMISYPSYHHDRIILEYTENEWPS